MRDEFAKRIALAVVILLGLLALNSLPRRLAHSRADRVVGRVVREMHNGELNAEDLHILAAGYYEGLRNDVPVTAINPGNDGTSTLQSDVRPRQDFLSYEFKPNVKRSYAAGMRITNSFGMASPEYSIEKPPHAWRIALLGDSLSVGPYGHDFGTLLENRLNHDSATFENRTFQILNFSVYGYAVPQMMDAALEEAPRFHPDVYLVAMTGLEFIDGQGWREHVGRLVLNRKDLKYQFLREVVARAGVRPSDRLVTMAEKLKPFFIPVTRWALGQIRDHAASQGAQMIIVLVPGVINPDFTANDFNRLHPAVDGLGVPVIDLRDTFRSVSLRDFEVTPGKDFHPNARGHERIFDALYSALQARPEVLATLTGTEKAQPAASPVARHF